MVDLFTLLTSDKSSHKFLPHKQLAQNSLFNL